MTAICNFNNEMIDLFIQFYGDQINSQIWQMNKGIQNILRMLSDENQNKNNSLNDDDAENYERSQLVNLFDTKSTFIINKEKMIKTILKLSEFENVDLNCHFSSYTLLSYSCEVNDFELLDFLLKSEKVNVNSYSPSTGNTPLMVAILNNNTHIAQILIDNNKTDINHRNCKDQTALTIAASTGNESIIQSLINSEKFDVELSAPYGAYFRSTNRINNLLLNVKDFDVNKRIKIKSYIDLFDVDTKIKKDNQRANGFNDFNQVNDFSYYLKIPFITPLIKAVLDLQEEMIDEIVSHPLFNKEKSCYVDALFASIYMNDINIFHKLLSLFGNDVNLIGNDGHSLLYFSVFMNTNEITTDILNNQSFDSQKSQLVSAFMKAGLFYHCDETYETGEIIKIKKNMPLAVFGTPRFGLPNNTNNNNNNNNNANNFGFVPNALIAQMNELYDFDENNDKLIKLNESFPSGKTYFTSIGQEIPNINQVVNFLIEHDADPNLPDSNGVYPIEYAALMNDQQFINSMIHLNDINLSIQTSRNPIESINGNNILHLLNQNYYGNNNDIAFFDILDMPDLDIINVENEVGDTPLLVVCRIPSFSRIMKLFSKDNLDYKHRNKNGEDAIDILKKSIDPNSKCQYNNRIGFRRNPVNQFYFDVNDCQPDEKREYYQKIIDLFQ